jgi:hypothetical protein
MNPLFKQLGGMGAHMPGPMGQFHSMVQQFQKFRQSFTGDPKAEVEKLLRIGQMSQQQLDQLQQAAQMFQCLLGGQ